MINAPERQLKSLGLDHDSLQAVHPGVLFCRLDCLGGPRQGPKNDYIGYDDIIQANSGIMTRFGGAATPEEHAHLGTLDVNCGFAAGLAVAVALFHKLKTGQISRARTSLSAVTNLAQVIRTTPVATASLRLTTIRFVHRKPQSVHSRRRNGLATTRSILSNVGYNDAEIDSMIERKIAGLGWGKEFLPN